MRTPWHMRCRWPQVVLALVFELAELDAAEVLQVIQQRTGRAIAYAGAPTTDTPCVDVEAMQSGTSLPRVRVLALAVASTPIVGELLSSDERTLTIRPTRDISVSHVSTRTYGEPLVLARDSVTRLETSERESKKRAWAGVGAGIGALLVTAIGLVATADEDSAQGVATLAALCGTPLGAAVGWAVAPAEKWVVQDPNSVKVGLAWPPASRRGIGSGIGLTVSVRF